MVEEGVLVVGLFVDIEDLLKIFKSKYNDIYVCVCVCVCMYVCIYI
jgi:hypothetical protein